MRSIIRTNTQARLDREIQGDVSVYSYYPYQIISIDFIKSDIRRQVFINECPELVIVDEAHTCARPAGATKGQQQRYALISDIANKPDQHLVMLTATPHSGKPEEFHSLLGLLKPEFEDLDVATSSQTERRELARHFIQRKRADVEKWMGEDTPFPTARSRRDRLPAVKELRRTLRSHSRLRPKAVTPTKIEGTRQKRLHYWTALGLLRGVMSSPAAGIAMLQNRMSNLEVVRRGFGHGRAKTTRFTTSITATKAIWLPPTSSIRPNGRVPAEATAWICASTRRTGESE